MPPRTKSPARKGPAVIELSPAVMKSPVARSPSASKAIPATDRVTRRSASTSGKAEVEANYKAATFVASLFDEDDEEDKKIVNVSKASEFRTSVLIYLSCLTTLSLAIAFIVYTAPPAPKGGVCNGVDSSLAFRLIPKGIPGKREQDAIVTLWRCTTAYQATNWWFVLSLFQLVFLGLKSFALPVSFALSILGGAIFPFPLSQGLVSMGETCGSSLCYLLSSAIAKPILEYLVPAKLISLRKRAEEERDNMFLFNIFLRLSPAPNWLVNLASPAMGNPLPSFFFGTLFGTFFPTLLLTRTGQVLRTVGEKGFDLPQIAKENLPYLLLVGGSQVLPILLIRYKNKQKSLAKAAAKAA